MAARVFVNRAQVTLAATRIGFGQMRRVLRYAHRQAYQGAVGGPYSRTGALANSITSAGPFITGSQVLGTLFSPLSYAASVERGAEIHPIWPKGAQGIYRFGSKTPPQLKFWWRGRVVYTPHVPMSVRTIGLSHPGQKGKRFLRNALVKTAARYQMRFIPGPGSL